MKAALGPLFSCDFRTNLLPHCIVLQVIVEQAGHASAISDAGLSQLNQAN